MIELKGNYGKQGMIVPPEDFGNCSECHWRDYDGHCSMPSRRELVGCTEFTPISKYPACHKCLHWDDDHCEIEGQYEKRTIKSPGCAEYGPK